MAPRARPGAASKVDCEDGPPDEMEDLAQLSDTAIRKKKNADAQAAFRARRASYVAVLEETVTNLESIVDHIQESLRILENESEALCEENKLLKQSGHERDALWRALWHNHSGTGSLPESAIPPWPAVFGSSRSPTTAPLYPSLRSRPLYAYDSQDYSISSSSVADESPPKMNTVAVLKAHTFGTLRRTRTQKRVDDAVKLSQEALKSRGITVDFIRPHSKRRRTCEEDSL